MKIDFIKKLFLLLGATSALSAAAYDVHVGNGYYNLNKENQTASLTYLVRYDSSNADAYVGDVVIPDTFECEGVIYTVASVEQRAFYSCTELTSIVLPETIMSIGANAFYDCTKLAKVQLPSKLSIINPATFLNCSSLENIELPDGLNSIGNDAFAYCSSLQKVVFPSNCTTIGSQSFYACTSLKELRFSDKTTEIGYRAFFNCSQLTAVRLPERLNSLSVSIFEGCSNLNTVYIGGSLTSIDHYAFFECRNLQELYFTSSAYPRTIQETAFYDTPDTKRIHVDNTLVESYHSKSVWRDFAEILPNKCEIPKIRIDGHDLCIVSSTNLNYTNKDEKFTFDVQVSDLSSGIITDDEMADFGDLQLTYDVRVKATAEGCADSDEVAAQISWINFLLVAADDDEGATTAIEGPTAQRPVLATSRGGELILSGLNDGERVVLYDLSGRQLGTTTACGGSASFSAASGQVVVARVAGSSFKIRVN